MQRGAMARADGGAAPSPETMAAVTAALAQRRDEAVAAMAEAPLPTTGDTVITVEWPPFAYTCVRIRPDGAGHSAADAPEKRYAKGFTVRGKGQLTYADGLAQPLVVALGCGVVHVRFDVTVAAVAAASRAW